MTDDDEASRAREPSTNVQQQLLSLLAGNAAESTDTVVRHELIDSGVQYVGLGAQELHSNGLRFSGVDEKGKAKVRDADFAVGQAGEAQTAHNPTRVKEGILAVRPREITCPNPKPRRSPTVESTLTSPGKMTSVFVPSEPAKESFPLRARQTLIGLAKDENPLSYAGKATETVAEEESRDKPAADAAVAIKTVAPVRVGHHAIPKRRAVSLNAALRAQTHIQGWADPLGIVQKSLIPRPVQVTKPEGVNPTNSISRWNSLPLHKSLKPAKKLSPDVTNGVSPADKQTKSVKITLPSGTRGEAPLPSLQMPSDGPPEWASRLTEELSEPGMARRNGSGSAFTPTTTTTGSVGRGRNFPGPSSALPMPSPRTATMASRQQPSGSCFAEASVTRPQANAGTTAGSSQPVVTPSSSPSTDRRHETPGTDTMSSDAASHQVNPMKLRTKVPSPQASTRTAPTAYTAAQHTSTCTSAAAAAEESRSTPPTSQQPPRLQTSLIPAAFRTPSFSNSNPAPSLSQAIAQGAAQVAVVQSLKLVDAPTPPPRMSTPMSQSPSETEQQTSQRRQTKTKSQKRDLLEEEEHSGTGLEKHRPLRLSSLAMYKRSTAKGGRQLAIAAKLLQVKPDKTTSSTSSKEPSNSSSNSSGSDTTGNVVIVAPFRTSSRLPSPRCVDGGASDKSLGPNDGPSPTAPSDPMPYSPLTVVTLNNGGNIGNGSLPRLVLTLIIAATTLVWREAAPVFDATSDVRRRAALRQSTWRDVFAYLLASSLVFAALVGTAWAVRLGGLVAGLLAEVFDGIRWLLGM